MNNYEIKGALQLLEDGDWFAFVLWPFFVLYFQLQSFTDEMAPTKPKKWLTAKIIQRVMRLQQQQRHKENWCQLSLHRAQHKRIKCLVFKMNGFIIWDHDSAYQDMLMCWLCRSHMEEHLLMLNFVKFMLFCDTLYQSYWREKTCCLQRTIWIKHLK